MYERPSPIYFRSLPSFPLNNEKNLHIPQTYKNHISRFHLGPNIREDDATRRPKHADAAQQRPRLEQHRRVRDADPDGVHGDGEEVVDEDEGLADDAGE